MPCCSEGSHASGQRQQFSFCDSRLACFPAKSSRKPRPCPPLSATTTVLVKKEAVQHGGDVAEGCAAGIEVVRHLPTSIRVRVLGPAPCVGCSVDAFIRLGGLRYDVQFSPVLTDEKGMLDLHFPDTSIRSGMTLWSMVTSVDGVSFNTVNTTTCTWGGRGRNATVKLWCRPGNTNLYPNAATQHPGVWQQAELQPQLVAKVAPVALRDTRSHSAAMLLCARYEGVGRWGKDGHWVEDGCHSLRRGAALNLRIAFVGDSVLRNLFYEWCSPRKWAKTLPYATSNNRYFEEYGYYPILPYHTLLPACCGEPDCQQRQAGRAGREGYKVLELALQWKPDILVIRSPIIHHGRSYVSDATHRAIVTRILRLVPNGTIWMSTTPLGSTWTNAHNPWPEQYLDQGTHRRYRLYAMEKEMLAKLRPDVRWWDVWEMTYRRRGECCFVDPSHVWPSNGSNPAIRETRPLTKEWAAMLHTLLHRQQ